MCGLRPIHTIESGRGESEQDQRQNDKYQGKLPLFILTAISGEFLFVMGAGLWMWSRTSLLPLLDASCL